VLVYRYLDDKTINYAMFKKLSIKYEIHKKKKVLKLTIKKVKIGKKCSIMKKVKLL